METFQYAMPMLYHSDTCIVKLSTWIPVLKIVERVKYSDFAVAIFVDMYQTYLVVSNLKTIAHKTN